MHPKLFANKERPLQAVRTIENKKQKNDFSIILTIPGNPFQTTSAGYRYHGHKWLQAGILPYGYVQRGQPLPLTR